MKTYTHQQPENTPTPEDDGGRKSLFWDKNIFIYFTNTYALCKLSDLQYIEATGNSCYVYVRGHPRALLRHTLDFFEKKLCNSCFVRVHRSFIVNINWISRLYGNTLCIGEQEIPIGQHYHEKVFNHLLFLGGARDSYK